MCIINRHCPVCRLHSREEQPTCYHWESRCRGNRNPRSEYLSSVIEVFCLVAGFLKLFSRAPSWILVWKWADTNDWKLVATHLPQLNINYLWLITFIWRCSPPVSTRSTFVACDSQWVTCFLYCVLSIQSGVLALKECFLYWAHQTG